MTDSVTIRVPAGALAGRRSGDIVSFLGIPYAAAPFGENRFRDPRPPQSWDGIRVAAGFGPAAPQPNTLPFIGAAVPRSTEWGYDCLTLNVRTPDAGSGRLPVMVYIHGGGYVCGSGGDRRADGTAFARDGVVYVSINYRLGVDGFLPLPGVPTNLGLRDQLCALRWIRENIAGFGGDPDNITVFGSSAGAGSLAAYAASPAAQGLFRRIILQSAPVQLIADPGQAEGLVRRIATVLGPDFARLPIEELMRRHLVLNEQLREPRRWGPTSYLLTPYMPVVDGEIVPDAALSGRIPASMDVLVGTNRDEARLFLLPNEVLDSAGPEDVRFAHEAYRVPAACAAAAADLYRGSTPGEQLSEIITDHLFRGPSVDLARAHAAAGGTAFTYEFAWRPSPRVGATHTLELPFVFDRLTADDALPLVGPTAPQELSRAIRRSWIAFATHGDPGWSRYDETDCTTMIFDTLSQAGRDPREAHRLSWDENAAHAAA